MNDRLIVDLLLINSNNRIKSFVTAMQSPTVVNQSGTCQRQIKQQRLSINIAGAAQRNQLISRRRSHILTKDKQNK